MHLRVSFCHSYHRLDVSHSYGNTASHLSTKDKDYWIAHQRFSSMSWFCLSHRREFFHFLCHFVAFPLLSCRVLSWRLALFCIASMFHLASPRPSRVTSFRIDLLCLAGPSYWGQRMVREEETAPKTRFVDDITKACGGIHAMVQQAKDRRVWRYFVKEVTAIRNRVNHS